MKKRTVYTIGNLTIDDIVLWDTAELYIGATGGNSVFAALGFWIWDVPVTLLGRCGMDYSRENLNKMWTAGLSPKFTKVQKRDIRNWALYEPDGTRRFINHLTSSSHYEMSITGDEIAKADLGGDLYHVAPMPTDIQATIVDRLKRAGRVVALDPHVDYLQDPILNQQAYDMLSRVDYFLPSQEEVVNMSGYADMARAAQHFAGYGPEIIVIKMSKQGSLVYSSHDKTTYHIPIYPTKTVDPTGAGDSFCGGFLAGLLLTGDPILAACYGTVSASYVVEQVGALSLLEKDFYEAQKRLESVSSRVTEQ